MTFLILIFIFNLAAKKLNFYAENSIPIFLTKFCIFCKGVPHFFCENWHKKKI